MAEFLLPRARAAPYFANVHDTQAIWRRAKWQSSPSPEPRRTRSQRQTHSNFEMLMWILRDAVLRPAVLGHFPGDSLYGWICFRLITQPIAAPTANVTATVSSRCRCMRLLVSSWNVSGIHDELFCGSFASLNWKPHVNRLHTMNASPQHGGHIGLRYPLPDHRPCIKIGAFTHSLACLIVVQKGDRRFYDGGSVPKRNQHSAAIFQCFRSVPVWSRDDGLSGTKGIRQGSRYGLRFVTVRRDVNVCTADK